MSPPLDPFESALSKAAGLLSKLQSDEGYWWFPLEANETIGAGFIQLMHFLGEIDPAIQEGLARRILSQQGKDGSWSIFYNGPGDLSATIECYFALRLAGYPPSSEPLIKAKGFILQHGGLAKARVFTHIHLALFGLVPWSSCPAMPVWFMLLPSGCGISIYEFSSWARASIVPLLLVLEKKPVVPLPFSLDELTPLSPPNPPLNLRGGQEGRYNIFLGLDKFFKILERLPWHPGKKRAIRKAKQWVREHIERTEDIYPAMAYSAIAMKALGYPNSDPTIRKAVGGLKRFQQKDCRERSQMQGACEGATEAYLEGTPQGETERATQQMGLYRQSVHQQCCISPLWDTPWAGLALMESGIDPGDPRILKAARYMIGKEMSDFRGDWRFKNPRGPAGGWSFEFQNDFFPDVDDTIEIVAFLKKSGLPDGEKEGPIRRGLEWLLSMQSKNGGWAAFDKDNTSSWVNKIPFSDHGACLDPPTPDITGRMIEILASLGFKKDHPVVSRAIDFLRRSREATGSWRGRWGVNYIYGTWAVLQGLATIGIPADDPLIADGARWLLSTQNPDGGWGESCLSDSRNEYVPLGVSVPSQTAWALMALISTGESDLPAVQRGIQWLMHNQKEDGGWDEPYYTGTGFPGHFYLNYNGYRLYFPLLALGRFNRL